MSSQKLRGLVGQSMSGRRPALVAYAYNYPVGSYTFIAPAAGVWRIVLWGGGGGGNNAATTGGGSGAYYEAERFLAKGEKVSVVVGQGGGINGGSGGNTTATFPAGEVLSAGGASGQAGGAVTANRFSDVVLAGSAGGSSGAAGGAGAGDAGGTGGAGATGQAGGAGAPGRGTHRGGDGLAQNQVNRVGECPGAGGATSSASGSCGGDGMALIYRVKLRY